MDILETLDREGLQIASNQKRILAFIIDDLIISLIIFIAFYNQIMEQNGNMEAINNLLANMMLYIIILRIAYQTLFTTLYGASIGKIICKIKIVRIDTIDKPNFLQSLGRSIIRTISEILFYIPLLLAFADPFKRALHDILLKTIVIDVSLPQDIEES
ncbi:hypothetical protein CCY99_04560 [Helicobacter sp. 16-1353]|uniref:RDD family protein n=1 Tax=Helicobacter sp. 16-1353 TaxID=2004996 RepID=UPI000DCF1139|nr:RDD family protein [Helicobacter sp. 16-1353]RAX54288.1 hypothetical protein CCY99_04560 [Helicobacter sp. 16-1353]